MTIKNILSNKDTPWGTSATMLNGVQTDLEMPTPEKDNKVATLNQKGFMRLETNKVTDDFISYASQRNRLSMEVNCAYGHVAGLVLKDGGKIIANDANPDHLAILNKNTPTVFKNNLILNTNSFPEMDMPEASLDAIYLGRILHFLTPQEMDVAFKKLQKWIRPGGRVYVVAMTPLHASIPSFEKEYETRWENGEKWPGVITDMKARQPHVAKHIPDYIHVLDHKPLTKALEEHGFKVTNVDYFDYKTSHNASRTGKEYIGLIAERDA